MHKFLPVALTFAIFGPWVNADVGAASIIEARADRAAEASGGPGTLNSIDTIVSDMRLRNDFVLKGYESFKTGWYVGPGENFMGNNPRYSNNPTWSIYYDNPTYAGKVAKSALPWVVVFDGVNHSASNVAVEMRNMRTYIKSRSTGKWLSMSGPAGTSGTYYGKPSTGLPDKKETAIRQSADSSTVKLPADRNYFWHGWGVSGHVAVDADDTDAIFVTVQARIVVADSSRPDDLALAQVGLQVGADYYLDAKSIYTEGYAPAIGISRTKTITRQWQAFNFATLSDVGNQQPGGGITEASLRATPPPME